MIKHGSNCEIIKEKKRRNEEERGEKEGRREKEGFSALSSGDRLI